MTRTTPALAVLPLIALAPSLAAQTTPEEMLPVVERAFEAEGCSVPGDSGEQRIGQRIADELAVSYVAVMDRRGAYYDVIDDAFELLIDSGRLDVDPETGAVTLVGCGG